MLSIMTKAPYKRPISWEPCGPVRYEAVCFEAEYRIGNTRVELLIEIDETGVTTGIVATYNFGKPTKDSYLSMERIFDLLDRGWDIAVPPRYCLWNSYESDPDVFTICYEATGYIWETVSLYNLGE